MSSIPVDLINSSKLVKSYHGFWLKYFSNDSASMWLFAGLFELPLIPNYVIILKKNYYKPYDHLAKSSELK